MPVYRIAKLNIRIEPLYPQTAQRLKPFLTDSPSADFDASAAPGDVEAYLSRCKVPCVPHLAEGSMILTEICRTVLRDHDGCFFHSSALMMDGEAYLFTALSGTGKSTHTALWRKHFGDRVTMINDDKPIVRRIDGKYWVCSTPWMGKSEIGSNIDAPVKAVYVLQRAEKNSAVRVNVSTVFRQLFEATLVPREPENMQKLLALFDGLFSQAKLFLLKCNQDEEAAAVAYEAAKEDSDNDEH